MVFKLNTIHFVRVTQYKVDIILTQFPTPGAIASCYGFGFANHRLPNQVSHILGEVGLVGKVTILRSTYLTKKYHNLRLNVVSNGSPIICIF